MKVVLAALLLQGIASSVLEAPRDKNFVVVCNAYADRRAAIVGIRPTPAPAGVRVSGFAERLRLRRRKTHAMGSGVHSEGAPFAIAGIGGVALLQRPDARAGAAAAGRAVTATAAAAYAAAASAASGTERADQPMITSRSPLRSARQREKKTGPSSPLEGATWIRSLQFGDCDEYHVDLSTHQLFFMAPGQDEATNLALVADRLVAVLTQPEASSGAAAVQSVALVRHPPSNGLPVAELVALDGFTQAAHESELPVEAELARMERKKGLKPLPPLNSAAVVRLEEEVQLPARGASLEIPFIEGLGASYAVEPRRFHMMFEDLNGARMLDRRDVVFQGGRTHVAMRVGKLGDPQYPQRLIVYRVKDNL